MIHGEAAPGTFDDLAPPHAMIKSTIVFLPLFAPFGISSGYVSVTLGFQLGQAGVPTAVIAGLLALSVWPQTWKMLWAPLVDTIGNPKLWYGLGTGIVALTILLMSGLQIFNAHPALYWGKSSYTGRAPLLEIHATQDTSGRMMGTTRIGGTQSSIGGGSSAFVLGADTNLNALPLPGTGNITVNTTGTTAAFAGASHFWSWSFIKT